MTSLKRPLNADPQSSKISSKVFIRSTKSGKVQKIVRELYLRQDIPCSSKLCSSCLSSAPADANGQVAPFVLSDRPAGTKAFREGHYLVPDTNALLNALDLFEQSSAFYDVIILQIVLEELRNRSLPLYNRLVALTKSEDKRFYVFFNEFRLETYVSRLPGETINDRNDRAVRRAVQWYGEHLRQSVKAGGGSRKCPAIVMLSDDKENLRKAGEDRIQALSLRDYVSGLEDADRLLDMISEAREVQDAKPTGAQLFYPEYYSTSKMMTGVKAGTLHQGIFNVSQYNFLEGSIHVPAFNKSLIVLGRENINRAVQGDIAVVEVLPKDQWKRPSSKIIEEDSLNKNENADDDETEAIVTESERRALQEEAKRAQGQSVEGRPQPTARVVGIAKRNWRQYVGHVDTSSVGLSLKAGRKQQSVFLLPMDKRIPKIRVRTRQAGELIGKRILVTIDSWDRESRHPVGHFVRSLGELETQEAETEALLLEYDVQYRPFPQAVLECLPKEGHDWKVPADLADPGWKGRRDLRDLIVCSIDPPGCQDIDDALHARQLPNGNFEVGVHIADVSNFVKPNNAMDTEASTRGTTVYLVDKRIDMLPMLLGTDLCSLKPYVERFSFSVIWEMTPEAVVVSSSYSKSVIRSREAFSYEQAQLRIDDQSQQDELTQGMRTLMMLSKKLRQKRMDAGALNLASPEVKIQTDSETSDPVDIESKKMLDTNSLVEECMLLANISVAEKIYEAFPQTALLRRHAAPPRSNFDELSNQLKVKRDLTLDPSSSKALATSLDGCVSADSPFFNTLIRIMATRCMMSAEYFTAGTQSEPEFRHYGLATPIYTHFTSPIRRYADLVVHRQLAAAIGYDDEISNLLLAAAAAAAKSPPIDGAAAPQIHPQSLPHQQQQQQSKIALERICKNINVRHRNAQQAGRASVEYYVGQALKGRIVVDEDAYVMKVFSNGFVVYVPRFGIEGLIRLRDLPTATDTPSPANPPDPPSSSSKEPDSTFDAENYVLTIKGWAGPPSDSKTKAAAAAGPGSRRDKAARNDEVKISLFDKVQVRISDVREEGTGKRKVRFELAGV